MFKSDLRISSSFEQNLKLDDIISQQSSIRFKERTSFKFFWIVFDMTVTQGYNPATDKKTEINYEVEVEIHDIDHLIRNLNNREGFNKIILRFVQNVAALMKIINRVTLAIGGQVPQTL